MLLETIQKDLTLAMKAKDENAQGMLRLRLGTLRMVKTALDKYEKDGQKPLDDKTEQAILSTLVKQRRDSIEMFMKGNRPELAAKEEAEIKVIQAYMHAEATADDIEAAVLVAIQETGATSQKQMGLVMKLVQTKLTGKRIDGKIVADIVKAKLV